MFGLEKLRKTITWRNLDLVFTDIYYLDMCTSSNKHSIVHTSTYSINREIKYSEMMHMCRCILFMKTETGNKMPKKEKKTKWLCNFNDIDQEVQLQKIG